MQLSRIAKRFSIISDETKMPLEYSYGYGMTVVMKIEKDLCSCKGSREDIERHTTYQVHSAYDVHHDAEMAEMAWHVPRSNFQEVI